jgi:lysophospholipase L1-like esterase
MTSRCFHLRAPLAAALVLVGAACADTPTEPAPARWPSTAPGLTCPVAFAVTGVVGGSQAVTYPQPVTTGDTAFESLACTPASGSEFSLGATTVTCRGRDRLGREASCGFVVTLQPSTLGVKTFVAFGDSVTEGQNALPEPGVMPLFVDVANAYPTKLQGKFDADFPGQGITTINEGRGGERATDGVSRLAGVLAQQKPGALLLLDGYNDLLNDQQAAVQPVANAIRDMVRIARAAGVAHVFVSTITPSRPGLLRTIPSAIIVETNFLIRQVVASEGVVLVDAYDAFFGQESVLVGADGLHLTPAGNEVLAAAFYTAIRNRVPTSSLATPAFHPTGHAH